MSLFQSIVAKKYIQAQAPQISEAYGRFTAYFHRPEIQQELRNIKEEEFQEGFLRKLFVEVLGYTLRPDVGYNLRCEEKNVNDSKKADGAILLDGEVVGVIELKDHKTTDLKQVEAQAFGYKNNHRNVSYVVVSNFEKLRFYIDHAVDFVEFNLFSLTEAEFGLLWVCLAYSNVAQGLPKQIKAESINNEDKITKELYRDYSVFKRALFDDLVALNPQFDKLTLFKKSQKLLDRLLFVFFAEDKGLLPPNSIKGTISKWEAYASDPMNAPQSLYSRLQRYFHLLNVGYKDSKTEVFAYNGGLFKADEVLDSVAISDEVLKGHIEKLAGYDFDTEVDVNILGHIFENSLNEIEEVTAELTTGVKPVSKRKKDGVFYTPKYITTYIVENTLGRLCADKKAELGVVEGEYFADKKRQIATKLRLDQKLKDYRAWLLELTICDPACGSGAFLNAALDFLIAEHGLVDEMSAKLHGDKLVFPDVENAILENNLFGVDINDESIEIAKLSLWLRTAKPHRKLNSLSDNIKCGNSLISDPAVAGDKAFDWAVEFPQVFARGGFDVIIGNPPYVFARENVGNIEKEFYSQNYVSAKYQVNTYILFMEKALCLLKHSRMCGLIIPNSWLMVYSGEDLRKFLMQHCTLTKIANLIGRSFEDANVETVIFIAQTCQMSDESVVEILSNDEKSNSFVLMHTKMQKDFSKNKGLEFNVFSNDESTSIIEKLKSRSKNLDDVCSVKAGLQAYEKGKGMPIQSAEDVKKRPYDFSYKYNEHTYKYLEGSNVLRYGISWSGTWLWYGQHLAAPRSIELFSEQKIIIREITDKYPRCIVATYSDELFLFNRSNIAVVNRERANISLKYVTAVLNSSLMSYYFTKNTAKAERKLFPKIILNDLRLFPMKEISLQEQQPCIDLADKMLRLNKELAEKRQKFISRLSENFEGVKITGALEKFDELEFVGFVKELKKQKIVLSLKQQDEWEEYFADYKTACNALSAEIAATDRTIDQMVYKLYDLTPEEIALIENA